MIKSKFIMYKKKDESRDASEEREATCKVCKQKIIEKAIKCIHCDSFQDWRRYLSISNTSLALLAALFSAISVSISSIASVITPRNHTIYATFNSLGGGVEGQKEKRLAFYIWNEGKEPGGIHEVSLTYNLKNGNPVKIKLYSDANSKRDLLKYEEHGEIFLKAFDEDVKNLLKLDMNDLLKISGTELSCKVEIYSLGIKGKKRKVLSESIDGDSCIAFLKSYE